MNRNLRKAIAMWLELERKYLKSRANENRIRYKKQKSFCSKLYKKKRKKFYSHIKSKNFTENKNF